MEKGTSKTAATRRRTEFHPITVEVKTVVAEGLSHPVAAFEAIDAICAGGLDEGESEFEFVVRPNGTPADPEFVGIRYRVTAEEVRRGDLA